MMMNEIDHDEERELTAETDHGHGCWEIFSEKAADEHGIAGRHDDEINGQTLWLAYLEAIEAGQCERQDGCPDTKYDGPVEEYGEG